MTNPEIVGVVVGAVAGGAVAFTWGVWCGYRAGRWVGDSATAIAMTELSRTRAQFDEALERERALLAKYAIVPIEGGKSIPVDPT